MSTPWSEIGDQFLSEGDWAIGQGPDAPDRLLFRHLLDLLARKQKPSVVEIGCGPGIEIEGLRDAGLLERVDYVGTDFTPELIESCRERHPDVKLALADVNDDLLIHADVVYARHVLEHVEEGGRALRNMTRAARRLTVVSWFIRPTWEPRLVRCDVHEGFIHQNYHAPAMIVAARRGGNTVFRLDFDHHLTRASVWLIGQQIDQIITAAAEYAASNRFLDALIPTPEEPWRVELRDAVRTIEETADHARRLIR